MKQLLLIGPMPAARAMNTAQQCRVAVVVSACRKVQVDACRRLVLERYLCACEIGTESGPLLSSPTALICKAGCFSPCLGRCKIGISRRASDPMRSLLRVLVCNAALRPRDTWKNAQSWLPGGWCHIRLSGSSYVS